MELARKLGRAGNGVERGGGFALANFGKRRERVVGFLRGLVPLYEGLVHDLIFWSDQIFGHLVPNPTTWRTSYIRDIEFSPGRKTIGRENIKIQKATHSFAK